MKIIGLSALYHDSAAALVDESDILCAVQEERFTRRKHDPSFPENALAHCMDNIPAGSSLDAIVCHENPVLSLDRVMKNALQMAPDGGGVWTKMVRSMLGRKIDIAKQARALVDADDKVLFAEHHKSHAASAFYPSPFDDAAVLVIDGVGEWATTSIWHGKGNKISPLVEQRYPHSLGLLYSAFTEYCGLRVNSGEYKLMGLAPYGTPRFTDVIREELIDIKPDGSFRLNTDYFGFLTDRRMTNKAFNKLFGMPALEPDGRLTLKHMDLAASIQSVLNDLVERMAREALRLSGSRKLCMAGGVALNCVANGRLLQNVEDLDEIWIQPASGDAGCALGGALLARHDFFNVPRKTAGSQDSQKGSLLGTSSSDADIQNALEDAGLAYEPPIPGQDRDREIARAIADGAIIGVFRGRMEFGPRALGNRSILADPRRTDAQKRINLEIKFRESWRPFAVAILSDRTQEYFDIEGDSPYMLMVSKIREEFRKTIDWAAFRKSKGDMSEFIHQVRSSFPSITHVDYSARVQSVDETTNPGFHSILQAFDDITGCPMLINTSLNVRGEPLVCSPKDAISCFVNTGLDGMVLGNHMIWKTSQTEEVQQMMGKDIYEPD